MSGVVFACMAALGLGLVARAVYFNRDARIKRALRAARATTIAATRDGEVVKIIGTVRYAARTVRAGLSGRTCALYSAVVVDNNTRSEIIREEQGVDFFVEDATGVALIRIGDIAPSMALVIDRSFVTTAIDSDDTIEPFMKRHGQTMEGLVFLKSLDASEGVLEAGERVAVSGLARWIADADGAGGSYREAAKALVLEASEALPLLLSDDPTVAR